MRRVPSLIGVLSPFMKFDLWVGFAGGVFSVSFGFSVDWVVFASVKWMSVVGWFVGVVVVLSGLFLGLRGTGRSELFLNFVWRGYGLMIGVL